MIRRLFLKTVAALAGLGFAKPAKAAEKPLVLCDPEEVLARIQGASRTLLLEIPKSEGSWRCHAHWITHQPGAIQVFIHRDHDDRSWCAGITMLAIVMDAQPQKLATCLHLAVKCAIESCEYPLNTRQHFYDPCCTIGMVDGELKLVTRPIYRVEMPPEIVQRIK